MRLDPPEFLFENREWRVDIVLDIFCNISDFLAEFSYL